MNEYDQHLETVRGEDLDKLVTCVGLVRREEDEVLYENIKEGKEE